jgi:hypothetical protein
MFGLMRRAERLPYCGTCKTLGTLYGQHSRLLLNHDTVFLAELLMEQSGEPDWGPAYKSFNCLTLPRRGDRMPLALEYAATVAVVLAHFHIADHRADSKQHRWRLAARFFSPSYRRAAARLKAWDIPLEEIQAILETQIEREAYPQSLAHVAEPTAVASALVFSHGMRLVGREDLADEMYRLGYSFGYLVYVLDAYEDRVRDTRTGNFNPLHAFPGISGRDEILVATAEVERQLQPDLAARLRMNVEERLGLRPRVLHHRCRKPMRDRWRDAVTFARSMRDRELAGVFKGAAVLASVSALAFLFPHQVRSADSWRQCLGVGMNLMAIGAVFATMPSEPAPSEAPSKKSSGSKGGGCCDSCDCGACDCCCECGVCDCL